jgi:hypothetical protein
MMMSRMLPGNPGMVPESTITTEAPTTTGVAGITHLPCLLPRPGGEEGTTTITTTTITTTMATTKTTITTTTTTTATPH